MDKRNGWYCSFTMALRSEINVGQAAIVRETRVGRFLRRSSKNSLFRENLMNRQRLAIVFVLSCVMLLGSSLGVEHKRHPGNSAPHCWFRAWKAVRAALSVRMVRCMSPKTQQAKSRASIQDGGGDCVRQRPSETAHRHRRHHGRCLHG